VKGKAGRSRESWMTKHIEVLGRKKDIWLSYKQLELMESLEVIQGIQKEIRRPKKRGMR